MAKIIWLNLALCAFMFFGQAQAQEEVQFSLQALQETLAEGIISQGPEALKLTRSAWGPDLYRQTVDAVVLIIVPKEWAGEDIRGSGIMMAKSGLIVTNWHVVQKFPSALIIFRPQPPQTMESLKAEDFWIARVLSAYSEKDLAFLKIERSYSGLKALPNFPIVPLEDPNNLEVGQDVFAIGHPQGLYWTYTEGVISQIRPRYTWELKESKHQATLIQTQTDISFGSSGGPLINKSGKLVGINTLMKGQAGLNFAISAHEIGGLLTENILKVNSLPK